MAKLWKVEGFEDSIGTVDLENLRFLRDSGKLEGRAVIDADSGESVDVEELFADPTPASAPTPQPSETLAPPVIVNAAPTPPAKLATEDPLRFVVPLNPSGWAIAAGYLGLFSVLIVFAPFAIFAGIMALRDIQKNPGKTGKGRAIFGLIMGVVGFVLLGLLMASSPKI